MGFYKLAIVLVGCLAILQGCSCESEKNKYESVYDDPANECIELNELLTTEVSPAGVRTVFQLLDCDGYPITDLQNDELVTLLDGESIRTEGDVAPLLTQEVDFDQYTLVLLDMSDSIDNNGTLPSMITAARSLVHDTIALGHKVAIYRFASDKYFAQVQDFSSDEGLLDDALDALSQSEGMGSTDLYGAVTNAVNIVEAAGRSDVLTSKTLVIFTDGRDEAHASSRETAQNAIDNTEASVFTVGLGGDVNKDELIAFGKDGFEWSEDADKLTAAFANVTKRITDVARSHYVVGVCSPRIGGWHSMTLVVQKDNKWGDLKVMYDANNFDIVGCDAQEVAFPCKGKVCGDLDGISCGDCPGTTQCSEEFVCEEVCTADIECGLVEGKNCGDCSDFGDSFACEENQCIDACRQAECGTVLGINCGDCSQMGDTFSCSQEHECIDACAEAQCGTVLGINCGDCFDMGENFGCDADHQCVDACEEAQCGNILSVDCGNCSSFGESFGCDTENQCVDACQEVECGTELGINCGSCQSGFQCNSGACSPTSLPGMTWEFVPGGEFTMGSNASLDPAWALDEQRREVSLSSFWIMDTEVTVAMYQTCVNEGGCNSSYVGTTTECNYPLAGSRQDHPINCISWDGLRQFCSHVGGDLPTESQWERAYRGDHDGVKESFWIYPWGNTPAPSCSRVVMNESEAGCGDGHTMSVGTKPATSFSLSNMAGNVSEWTRDRYAESFDLCEGPCVDPQGPAQGSNRVIRGGSWNSMFNSAFRTSKRDKDDPLTISAAIGGRCVKEINEE